jgi:SAM-dependent methyltransferase
MAASRYVDDVPYVATFMPELSPAWLDFTALLWGFARPDRAAGFAWCDLGCGLGVNSVAFAATHPAGQFHGVDMLPLHVEGARRLAQAAGVGNTVFHAADFGAAADLDLPGFDYITAHGVYSWVDDRAREDLRRFVDRHLKPGGKVYVSYNALPGRGPDMPFQRLMLEVAARFEGDSAERVGEAAKFVSRMRDIKTPALVASPMAANLLSPRMRRNTGYLVHELMGANWRPLSVVEMRRDMATIGLTPAGSATLVENFDSYMLPGPAQRLLARVTDPDLHAMVRDYMIDQCFRRDVFIRAGTESSEPERQKWLLATPFALAHPKPLVRYRMPTPGGEVKFDNPIARRMVEGLAGGARPLGQLGGPDVGADDLVANAMVLAAAREIWPVEAAGADAGAFNRVVMDRLGGPQELNVLALGCGTAIKATHKFLTSLRDGGRGVAAWRSHLAAYGAGLG